MLSNNRSNEKFYSCRLIHENDFCLISSSLIKDCRNNSEKLLHAPLLEAQITVLKKITNFQEPWHSEGPLLHGNSG